MASASSIPNLTGSVRKIALTGGIACGKSMVQRHLETLGVPVIDADHVTHDLYQHDEALKRNIRQKFGDDVFEPTGRVNREKLGHLVFNAPEQMKKLVDWIHPKVREKIVAFFQTHAQEKFAIAVIPVLFESNQADQYDEVWVVKATREQQIERLIKRGQEQGRALTREQAEARLNSQIPLDEKLKQAHVIIDNTGTLAETQAQISSVISVLRAKVQ